MPLRYPKVPDYEQQAEPTNRSPQQYPKRFAQ
jgi:hypothetical protein